MKEKLHKLIKESSLTQNEIAEMIGITYQSFSIKLNGHKDFTRLEILALKKVLGLTAEQIDDIFFTLED